jgi:hypothetical protein
MLITVPVSNSKSSNMDRAPQRQLSAKPPYLGLESTRGWHRETVLRMAPSLFCLYTVVVLFYDTMPLSNSHLRVTQWIGKEKTSFSDMIGSVRRYLWMEWVFAPVPGGNVVRKLPKPVRAVLDFRLVQAT